MPGLAARVRQRSTSIHAFIFPCRARFGSSSRLTCPLGDTDPSPRYGPPSRPDDGSFMSLSSQLSRPGDEPDLTAGLTDRWVTCLPTMAPWHLDST